MNRSVKSAVRRRWTDGMVGVLATTAFVLGVPKGLEFIQSFPGAEGLLVTERARAQTRGFFQYVAS